MQKPAPSQTSGSTLLMVIIMLFILSGLCTVSLTNGLSLQRIAEQQVNMEKSYLASLSGIEVAAARINLNLSPTGNYTQVNGSVVAIRGVGSGDEWVVQTSSTVGESTHVKNVPRMFRPSHVSYGLFVENFSGTWLAEYEVDGKIWTNTAQTISGFTDGGGNVRGPVFEQKNQTGASAFAGSTQFAATLDPDTDILSYTSGDKRFWDTYTDGFDVNVAMPGLERVDFASVKTASLTSPVLLASIDPDLVDIATATTGQVLNIPVDTGDNVEIRFNIENNAFGESSGVIHMEIGTDAELTSGTAVTYKMYATSLELIYFSKTFVPSPTRSKNEDFHVRFVENIVDVSPVDGIDDDGDVANILRGDLSIWTEDEVEIYAGIEYEDETQDKFTLVSGDDIELIYTTVGSVDGTPDLELHGGFVAADVYTTLSRFQFMNYNSGVVRGELRVFGSITAGQLYDFGVYTSSALTSGFLLQTEHDDRLIADPPAYSPIISDKFVIEQYY